MDAPPSRRSYSSRSPDLFFPKIKRWKGGRNTQKAPRTLWCAASAGSPSRARSALSCLLQRRVFTIAGERFSVQCKSVPFVAIWGLTGEGIGFWWLAAVRRLCPSSSAHREPRAAAVARHCRRCARRSGAVSSPQVETGTSAAPKRSFHAIGTCILNARIHVLIIMGTPTT